MLACLRATTAMVVGWTRRRPLRFGVLVRVNPRANPMGDDRANPVVDPRVYQRVDGREIPVVNGSMPTNGCRTS